MAGTACRGALASAPRDTAPLDPGLGRPPPAGRDSVGFPAGQEVKPHGGAAALATDAPRREQV